MCCGTWFGSNAPVRLKRMGPVERSAGLFRRGAGVGLSQLTQCSEDHRVKAEPARTIASDGSKRRFAKIRTVVPSRNSKMMNSSAQMPKRGRRRSARTLAKSARGFLKRSEAITSPSTHTTRVLPATADQNSFADSPSASGEANAAAPQPRPSSDMSPEKTSNTHGVAARTAQIAARLA